MILENETKQDELLPNGVALETSSGTSVSGTKTTTPSVNAPTPPQNNSIPENPTFFGNSTFTGGWMRSKNFVSGVSGWEIDANGDVEFNDGYFRGSLVAGSIDIPDTTSANSFHVDTNGNAWFGSPTIGGAVASILNTGVATFTGGNIIQGVVKNSIISQNFTCGHAITSGDAVYVSNGVNGITSIIASNSGANTGDFGSTTNYKEAQSINSATTIYVKRIAIKMQAVNAPTDDVEVALQGDSGGNPDGSDIAVSGPVDVGATNIYNFDFTTIQKLTASTTYWFVVRRTGTYSAINYYQVYWGGGTYSGGTSKQQDNTLTWFDNTQDLYFELFELLPSGYIGKAEAGVSGRYQNFIGFSTETKTTDEIASVSIAGIITGLSGLTPGQYYLSDTAGAISTSAGSATRKVGITISTTALYITNIW